VTQDEDVDCVDIETSSSDIESSLTSNVSDVQYTSGGQTGTLVCQRQPSTRTPDIKSGVRRSSDGVLAAGPMSLDVTTASPTTSTNLVDLAELSSDGVVQQHSRSAMTMIVDSGGQHVMVPVTQKHTTHATAVTRRHTAATVSSQAACGFVQPRQGMVTSPGRPQSRQTMLAGPGRSHLHQGLVSDRLSRNVGVSPVQQLSAVNVAKQGTLSLMTSADEMTQYLTTAVLPDYIQYSTPQSLQQHR